MIKDTRVPGSKIADKIWAHYGLVSV